MPSLIIDCPSCSRKLRVSDELGGTVVKCPTCGHLFQAPAGQAVPVTSPVPDTASPPSESGNHLQASEEDDERPWDESHQFPGRRDAEPHRGTLILVLGIASLVLATLGTCSMGLGGLVGLPLGIAAWVMGRRDLIKMRQHAMDREGEGLTQAGKVIGIIGTILGSLCGLGFLVYVGFALTMIANVRRATPPPVPPPPPVRPAPAPLPPVEPGNKAVRHVVPSSWTTAQV